MILSIFATLCLKGVLRMQASAEIAYQWHDGDGVHFARWIRALARHYQIFEQLPAERHGGRSISFLEDEMVKKHV